VLFNFVLGGYVKGAIGARNLYLRYTAHGLNIFKLSYGMEGFS